jgi:protein-S-isoprenylcysteine O-methyltransferase Ste14
MRARLLLAPLGVVIPAIMGTILFLVAGTYHLPFFWAYLGVYGACAVVGFLTIDPDLLQERTRSERRDRNPLLSAAKLLMLAHLVAAALDVGRYHWSDAVPVSLQVVGLIGFGLGFVLTLWAMVVNRFFVPTVRIQSERGHHVIDAGPYGMVRHPGYAGITLAVLCSGLVLGSWLSIIPMAVFVVILFSRIVSEDRFLIANLDGYREYAERVRSRLVPGIW